MKKILLILAIGIIFLVLLINVNGVFETRRYVFDIHNTQVEINFPTKPSIEETQPSETVENVQISSEGISDGYILIVSTYNPGFQNDEERSLVEENTSFLNALNKYGPKDEVLQIVSSQKTYFNGSPARIDEAENKDIKLRYIVFTNGVDQYYILSYSSGKENFSESKWQSYLDSFHAERN